MIAYSKADIFDVKANIYVNTVNCQGVMGKGIALEFKRRYPVMFLAYRGACFSRPPLEPGQLYVWHDPNERIWIVNLPTKREWRKNSQYNYIATGLRALREWLAGVSGLTVAVPALGCANGGLDWEVVQPMIEEALGDLKMNIIVLEPR